MRERADPQRQLPSDWKKHLRYVAKMLFTNGRQRSRAPVGLKNALSARGGKSFLATSRPIG